MIKAARKVMAILNIFKDVNYVMCRYFETPAAMKEAVVSLKEEGNCYVTSVQKHLQRYLLNKQFKL